VSQYARCADVEAFEASRVLFEAVVGELAGSDCVRATHGVLEDVLTARSRELFGQLLQDHLDLRAQREQRLTEVTDAEQVTRGGVETGHARALTTVFGQVRVSRLAYRRRGHVNLYHADGQLNLPVE
jgi:hypothetical protein